MYVYILGISVVIEILVLDEFEFFVIVGIMFMLLIFVGKL